jgi:hypothetical protein
MKVSHWSGPPSTWWTSTTAGLVRAGPGVSVPRSFVPSFARKRIVLPAAGAGGVDVGVDAVGVPASGATPFPVCSLEPHPVPSSSVPMARAAVQASASSSIPTRPTLWRVGGGAN